MANSRTLTAIVFLSICIARSHTKGEHNNTKQNPVIDILTDFKQQTFIEGSDVTLWCGNITKFKWDELIYIVWNISTQGKRCYLGLSPNLDNTCNDGKRLYNSSDEVSLFIPHISVEDEGFYTCDLSYKGGSYSLNISVSVSHLSTHLENDNGQKIAVCTARYKTEAPTLHWEPAFRVLSNIPTKNNSTSLTIKNRVDLDGNITELICVATYPSVQINKTLPVEGNQNSQASLNQLKIAISVGVASFILLILAVGYLLRKKVNSIRCMLKMLCCKSKTSTPAENKPPQPTDVEEVEPYASYIQRVNSIYNSSAELFNA